TSRKTATAADSWTSILVRTLHEDVGISLAVWGDYVPRGSLAVLGSTHDRQDGASHSGGNTGRLEHVRGVLPGRAPCRLCLCRSEHELAKVPLAIRTPGPAAGPDVSVPADPGSCRTFDDRVAGIRPRGLAFC